MAHVSVSYTEMGYVPLCCTVRITTCMGFLGLVIAFPGIRVTFDMSVLPIVREASDPVGIGCEWAPRRFSYTTAVNVPPLRNGSVFLPRKGHF